MLVVHNFWLGDKLGVLTSLLRAHHSFIDEECTGRMDYLGPDVNLAARVSGGARGGQIVLSEAAFREIESEPDLASVDVKFLGSFSYKVPFCMVPLVQIPTSLSLVSPCCGGVYLQDNLQYFCALTLCPPFENHVDIFTWAGVGGRWGDGVPFSGCEWRDCSVPNNARFIEG